jgi:hypothetical protein
MTPKPLQILKKGLKKLSERIKDRKNELTAKLADTESISPSDKEWLDNEGNTVDEQRVVETLEMASDYERGVERLEEKDKGIVQKLREWGGDSSLIAGNKRKRMAQYSDLVHY